jgi:hypothetical protein
MKIQNGAKIHLNKGLKRLWKLKTHKTHSNNDATQERRPTHEKR